MAIKIQPVSEMIEDSGLKVLVHGPSGVGKTVLSTTTGEKTLLISAESGLLSLKKIIRERPEIKPLMDGTEIRNIDMLDELYVNVAGAIASDDFPYKWVILDSVTEIAEVLLSEEKATAKDPRQAYGTMVDEISKILRKFRDLQHINIMMTSKQSRVDDSFTGVTSYVPMMPGKQLYQQIPYLFDEVFAMRIMVDEEGVQYRALQTERDIMYEAKDRSGMLMVLEKPDLKHIYDKIHNTE